MSSPAPEQGTQGPPKSSGKMGVWSKKLGPIPAWGWGAIGLAVILVYMYWKNKNSSTSTASDAGSSAAAGTTGAAQIPEFVNQTYTTVTPPTAPAASATPPAATPAPASSVIPGHHVITSTGKQTLQQIASQYGTTPADIIAFTKSHKAHQSPTETKFFGKPTGMVPKGIVLWVPEPQVTNVTGGGGGQS